jgi:hypothetical protein
MRALLLLCALLVAPAALHAQPLPQSKPVEADPYISTARPEVSIGGIVQRYGIEGGLDASAVSVPFSAAIPLAGGRVGVSVRAAYVSASLDSFTTVSGLADASLGAHVRQKLGPAEGLVGLNVGLPVGTKQLGFDAFDTAVVLSRNELAFAVPQVGQGLQVAPSAAIAVPLGPTVAFGAGVSYVNRGAYQPFAAPDFEYDPGNEVTLTAGVEANLFVTDVSLDVAYTRYSDDSFGDATFTPGNRFVATARVGGSVGYFLARYRQRADGTLPVVGGESRTIIPFRPYEIRLESGGRARLGPVALGYGGAARYYGDLRQFEEQPGVGEVFNAVGEHQLVFDVALRPAVMIGERTAVQGQFVYSIGLGTIALPDDVPRLVGFAAGLGLRVQI